MKSCKMGGQAVIEGVMMRYKNNVAVSVRKPDGDISVGYMKYNNISDTHPILKKPIIRGVVAFIDSLSLGIRTLMYSASIFEEEAPEDGGKKDEGQAQVIKESMNKKETSKGEAALMTGTVMFSLVVSVALFVLLPYFVSSLITRFTDSTAILAVVEGIIKVGIFIGYLAVISLMPDIKRTFMYHGSEHKCINCVEKGRPLTVHDVMHSSRQHKRCGTSFIFFVMIVSIILFFFIRVDNVVEKVVLRVLLMPVVAGISYEIIRLAGRSDNLFVNILSAPGMLIQRLTTREPDEDMVEVAIAAVEAVFDWKAYLKDNFGYEVDDSWMKDTSQDAEDDERMDETVQKA